MDSKQTPAESAVRRGNGAEANHVFVAGRFPPPVDGQTMATARLAQLLRRDLLVDTINLTPPHLAFARSEVRFDVGRISHYLRIRRSTRQALGSSPGSPVLWTSVSPTALGHARDLLTVLPATKGHRLAAVVHWGNFDQLFRAAITRVTARHLVDRVDCFVFLDDSLSDRCAPWIPASKRVSIPNTIDEAIECTDDDVVQKQNARADRERLHVLFLGNMIRSKGYLDLLASLSILKDSGVAVEVSFAGRWEAAEDERSFTDEILNRGLVGVVTHHGHLSDRFEAKRLYLSADVFVLPTYYPTEAQPLTIIEALNAGTPVVTTRHAGIPLMVRDGEDAVFVSPRSPNEIAAAIASLADPARWAAFSSSARARYVSGFSADAVYAKWLSVVDRLRAAAKKR